jgi:4-amino-4-deoxy-L-arabinose transferase-like glycosyltransferase
LAGIYAIYRFTKLYYSEITAYASALILGSCQAYILMNHDVRTDTILTNCVALAIWQIATFRKQGGMSYFYGGFIWIGLAMLAKGPIGLIVPGAAFFIDIVLKRDWKSLFRWEWLLGVLVVGVVLLPYCVGLYYQYGAEGIYFFFWKQSFGRITGENSWNNNAPLWFQAQNFLWSFLPWVLAFGGALFYSLRTLIKQGFRLTYTQEAISLGGFLLPFIALSTSHYQLPHYTFVVFPLGAVMTAHFLVSAVKEPAGFMFKYSKISLIITAGVMVLIVVALASWAFPLTNILIIAVSLIVLGYVIFLFRSTQAPFHQLVLAPFWIGLGCNFVMNAHIYPQLLTYQTGSELGIQIASQKSIPLKSFFMLDVNPKDGYYLFQHALDFYTARNTPILRNANDVKIVKATSDTIWLYTDKVGIQSLKDTLGLQVETMRAYNKYHVTGITLPFLNPELRSTRTREVYLVKAH